MTRIQGCAALIAALLSSGSANATSYYVSPTGSDGNAGTQSAPWLTITKGTSVAKAGDTVNVAPGTYSGGITQTNNGTSTAPIHFLSTTYHGAKIAPPSSSPNNTAFWAKGDYVDIDGFEINGTNYISGTNWTVGIEADGNNDTVEHNLIHNIHNLSISPCSGGSGGAGIDMYGFYYGKAGGTVNANTVHDVTWNGTCGYDQGIYANSPYITVSNNVVYNILGATAIENWHGATNNLIANNTVYNNYVGFYIGHDTNLGGNNCGTTVENNIAMKNTYGIDEAEVCAGGNTYRNNLLYQNTTDYYDMQNAHTGPADADPLFANAGVDFHLQSTSPAIGTGTATLAPLKDFDGVTRPNPPSIGSYEYAGGSLNGSTLSAGVPNLVTIDGSWTFGSLQGSEGNQILLNGKWDGVGVAIEEETYSGHMFVKNRDGIWYEWVGVGWLVVSGPQ